MDQLLTTNENPTDEGRGVETKCDTARPIRMSGVVYDAPASKQYKFKNGELTKGSNSRSNGAKILTFEGSFKEFPSWRKALGANTLITVGTFEADEGPVVYKDEVINSPGAVGADKAHLAFRDAPGMVIVDIDRKSDDEVAAQCHQPNALVDEIDELHGIMQLICPEAEHAPMLITDSTSARIVSPDGEMLKGTGGFRIYLPVSDAREIPRILETLHQRCWLHGYGWAFISSDGKFHERSLIDLHLRYVAQPDYAAPDLRNGLTQDRRWIEVEGTKPYLDVEAVQALSDAETVECYAHIDEAKDALSTAQKAAREAWLAEQEAKRREKGDTPAQARVAAQRLLDGCVLTPGDMVVFEDGEEVDCLALLTDGAAYNDKDCFDPLEPGYDGGRAVGKFYWNDGDRPGVHSFAHGSRWFAFKYDAKALLAREWGEEPDMDEVVAAGALTEFTNETEKALTFKALAKNIGLGNAFKSLERDIDARRSAARKASSSAATPDQRRDQAKIQSGLWPHDKRLPFDTFPLWNKDGNPYAHQTNMKILLQAYGVSLSYNVFLKDWDWLFQGINRGTDNADGAFLTHVRDLARMNGMSAGREDILNHLMTIADARQVNPVTDYLTTLEWDGQDRIGYLAEAMEPHDITVAQTASRLALIQACAAADGAEIARSLNPKVKPVYEYVLVFRSDQGDGKTKGLEDIVPAPLRNLVKTSVVLSVDNKDLVRQAVGAWICELGELDATFKQADHTAFKAFMSRSEDEIRLPYSATYSRFRRRTVFVGTVNTDAFLRDQTGSRRFFPLAVSRGFPRWPDEEIDQLWAQAWAAYASGAQWWPNEEEAVLFADNAEMFRERSVAEEKLIELYDWDNAAASLGTRKLSSRIGDEIGRVDFKGHKDIGAAMNNLWRQAGAVVRDGSLKFELEDKWVKVNATGGKNRGWLMPPRAGVRL
jgi:hypothetical protein